MLVLIVTVFLRRSGLGRSRSVISLILVLALLAHTTQLNVLQPLLLGKTTTHANVTVADVHIVDILLQLKIRLVKLGARLGKKNLIRLVIKQDGLAFFIHLNNSAGAIINMLNFSILFALCIGDIYLRNLFIHELSGVLFVLKNKQPGRIDSNRRHTSIYFCIIDIIVLITTLVLAMNNNELGSINFDRTVFDIL